MKRDPNKLLEEFAKSGVIFNKIWFDAEGSLIVDSMKWCENCTELKVETTLLCINNMDVHDINVKGNLICKGYMNATDVFVKGNLTCDCDANIGETVVLGDFICHGNMSSNGYKIIVHGDLLCEGNCDADVVVQGNFTCKGEHTGKYMPMG